MEFVSRHAERTIVTYLCVNNLFILLRTFYTKAREEQLSAFLFILMFLHRSSLIIHCPIYIFYESRTKKCRHFCIFCKVYIEIGETYKVNERWRDGQVLQIWHTNCLWKYQIHKLIDATIYIYTRPNNLSRVSCLRVCVWATVRV